MSTPRRRIPRAPADDAGPARMTPTRFADQVEALAVELDVIAVKLRRFTFFANDRLLCEIHDTLKESANDLADLAGEYLVGRRALAQYAAAPESGEQMYLPIAGTNGDGDGSHAQNQGNRVAQGPAGAAGGLPILRAPVPADAPGERPAPEMVPAPAVEAAPVLRPDLRTVHADGGLGAAPGPAAAVPVMAGPALCPDCGGFLDRPYPGRKPGTRVACHLRHDDKPRRMRMSPEEVRAKREHPPELPTTEPTGAPLREPVMAAAEPAPKDRPFLAHRDGKPHTVVEARDQADALAILAETFPGQSFEVSDAETDKRGMCRYHLPLVVRPGTLDAMEAKARTERSAKAARGPISFDVFLDKALVGTIEAPRRTSRDRLKDLARERFPERFRDRANMEMVVVPTPTSTTERDANHGAAPLAAPSPPAAPPEPEPAPTEDPLSLSVYTLDVPSRLCRLLLDAGIKTLGQLQEHIRTHTLGDGHIKGLFMPEGDRIIAALMDRLKDHPLSLSVYTLDVLEGKTRPSVPSAPDRSATFGIAWSDIPVAHLRAHGCSPRCIEQLERNGWKTVGDVQAGVREATAARPNVEVVRGVSRLVLDNALDGLCKSRIHDPLPPPDEADKEEAEDTEEVTMFCVAPTGRKPAYLIPADSLAEAVALAKAQYAGAGPWRGKVWEALEHELGLPVRPARPLAGTSS